jgi:uncharacterized protein (DUF1778 family)
VPKILKDERLDLRIPAEAKETIEKAAPIAGRSLTDFVVAATTDRAREVIRQSDAIALSVRDQAGVLAALDAPPEPSATLKRAAERSGQPDRSESFVGYRFAANWLRFAISTGP